MTIPFKTIIRQRGGCRPFKAFAAAILALLILAGTTVTVSAQEESGPEGRKAAYPHVPGDREKCSVCHKADEMPKLNFEPVVTCSRCHPGNVVNHPVTMHPMGKTARINVPGFLPLTKEGQIVCSTCHEPHNQARNPKMLRVEYLKLCASCHAGY